MLNTSDIQYIFNELRRASVKWSGRKECLALARKKVFVRRSAKGKAIFKFHWQCSACLNWVKNDKELEVDHISEIGGPTQFTGDWNETINKIFPRPVEKHLALLCKKCHLRKTRAYMAAPSLYKRKKDLIK